MSVVKFLIIIRPKRTISVHMSDLRRHRIGRRNCNLPSRNFLRLSMRPQTYAWYCGPVSTYKPLDYEVGECFEGRSCLHMLVRQLVACCHFLSNSCTQQHHCTRSPKQGSSRQPPYVVSQILHHFYIKVVSCMYGMLLLIRVKSKFVA